MRLLVLLLGVLLAAACAAQAYPSKPVRMVVPLAAGGTGDTLARFVSEEMAKILGQPFVVENRPGSGGVIGTEAVAKSPPDGYTLLSASPSHVIHPALRPKVGYDPIKDFEPITVIANTHQLIVGHPSVPAANVKELVAYAKKNPGKLNYGSAGIRLGDAPQHGAVQVDVRRLHRRTFPTAAAPSRARTWSRAKSSSRWTACCPRCPSSGRAS